MSDPVRIGKAPDETFSDFAGRIYEAQRAAERANPGMLAAMVDPETDSDGHVTGMTVTVIPE